MASDELQLHIFQQHYDSGPSLWILELVEGSFTSWVRIIGGSSDGEPYKLLLYPKDVGRSDPSTTSPVGTFPAANRHIFSWAILDETPIFSQQWVVNVLARLEEFHLIPQGQTQSWRDRMEDDPSSDTGAAHQNPRYCMIFSKTPKATASTDQAGWVWDKAAAKYRCWDAACNKWVWQKK